MFGYVVCERTSLAKDSEERYRGIYCGLCKLLRQKCGALGARYLTYDMVFLIIVLSALYEKDYVKELERCTVHPIKKHEYLISEMSEYGSDMNLLMFYYMLLDKIADEKSASAEKLAQKLRAFIPQIEKKYERQARCCQANLNALNELEKSGIQDPDAAANYFGNILGEIFVYKSDVWEDSLRRAGKSLGQFIYIMDAVCDLKKDIKTGSYNPLKASGKSGDDKSFYDLLVVMAADAAEAFELLPIQNEADEPIIKNILYSGVWLHYDMNFNKKGRNTNGSV